MTDTRLSSGSICTRNSAAFPPEKIWIPHSLKIRHQEESALCSMSILREVRWGEVTKVFGGEVTRVWGEVTRVWGEVTRVFNQFPFDH